MRKMMIWILICIAVGMAAYVRLAPSDPARWHQKAELKQEDITDTQSKTLKGGYIWRAPVTDGQAETKLAALQDVIEQTPRTRLLAGSADQGQLTYVTRSLVFGFPDYTTVGLYQTPQGQRYLEIYARLRFGGSDLGVNAQRVRNWLAALQV